MLESREQIMVNLKNGRERDNSLGVTEGGNTVQRETNNRRNLIFGRRDYSNLKSAMKLKS